jgi:hypothetical protein
MEPRAPFDPFEGTPFSYPPEVADVAEETLARYLRQMERQHPEYRPSQQRYMAIMLAEDNLRARADFRREISEYTNP